MSRDPVCGMDVEPSRAAGRSRFEGVDYDFCCADCQRQFDASPGRFAAPAPRAARVPCCGFGCGTVRQTVQRGAA